MIRRDEQRGVGGQRVDQLADEAVDERELAREHAVVQAELVRDRVDPRVVRVDEPLPGLDRAHALLDEAGHRVPAGEAPAAQVRLRETGVAELGARDDRYLATEERRMALHVEGIGRAAAARHRPPQHVEHAGVDEHAVPDDAVLRGRSPVAIDVSAVAVVDGATVVIGPPSICASRGITGA